MTLLHLSPYFEALKHYGVTFPSKLEQSSATQLIDSGGTILYDVFDRTNVSPDDHDMVEALFSKLSKHVARAEADQETKSMNVLISLRDKAFATHMHLWKTMVDAAVSGRLFTDAELTCFEARIQQAQRDLVTAEDQEDDQICLRAQACHDRALKIQYQLQFDDQMLSDIDRLVGNIINTRPTLIVGDKGIAKTQIAKFVMSLYGTAPLVVSVKGDMMSDELVGKMKHDKKNNTFVFQEGVLLEAMRKGVPLLLDEINFGDQAIIARLQDILLRRPGDTVFVQENDEEQITIRPGFMIFATANEASLRYRHREVLDPAIRDRFDIVMRAYPDLDHDPLLQSSPSLLRLAYSSAVDDQGILSDHIDKDILESFVHLTHITQYLYAVPAKDVSIELSDDQLKSVVKEDAQPLMSDCITPRTLSNVVQDCAAGNLPGRQLGCALIDRLVLSLDQAGSHHNAEIAEQVKLLLDFGERDDGLSS